MKRPMVTVPLLAFFVRVIHLQSRPLWYDEAFSILYSSLPIPSIVHGTVTPAPGAADVHPLLYYFLLHGWMVLTGQSPLAARFLSVMLGTITVILLWQLASWCFGPRTGVVVGLLGAVNPFHVAYSQEARMYALLALSVVMTAWALMHALEVRSSKDGEESVPHAQGRWWAIYVIGAALTLYAHNLGAFMLTALHFLVVYHRRWWHHLASLALADLVTLILFSPWLIAVLPGQIGFVEQGYWLSSPGIEELVRAIMLPFLTSYEPAPLWLLGIGLFLSLLLLILVVLKACKANSRINWFLLLYWLPILLLFLASWWRPLYLERALLPAALLYLVAVGWLLARGRLPHLLRKGLIVLLIIVTIGSLGVHYTYARFPRPPFQEAVGFLQAHLGADDAVIHTNKLTYFPMHVYAPDLSGSFLADPPDSPQDTLARPTQEALGIFATPTITKAVGTADRIWLVYFPREVKEAQAMVGKHPALDWVRRRFVQMEQKSFEDLTIALYHRESK